MYGSTIHTSQPGRVDRRGFAPRRTISVREGDWRAIRMYVRACINTRFLCICGELQGVHTLGSLYLRTIDALVVEKPNHDAKSCRRATRRLLGLFSLDIRGLSLRGGRWQLPSSATMSIPTGDAHRRKRRGHHGCLSLHIRSVTETFVKHIGGYLVEFLRIIS